MYTEHAQLRQLFHKSQDGAARLNIVTSRQEHTAHRYVNVYLEGILVEENLVFRRKDCLDCNVFVNITFSGATFL